MWKYIGTIYFIDILSYNIIQNWRIGDLYGKNDFTFNDFSHNVVTQKILIVRT